jgi:MFS family permease
VCLSLAFFFAELIVAPIWSVPMDIAPRYAGSASGMMNFGFGVAGLVSPSSFGYLVDRTGSWVVPFIGSIVLLLLGAVLALRLRPDQPFVEAEAIDRKLAIDRKSVNGITSDHSPICTKTAIYYAQTAPCRHRRRHFPGSRAHPERAVSGSFQDHLDRARQRRGFAGV